MKKLYILIILAAILAFVTSPVRTQENSSGVCRSISDGGLSYHGNPISTGYDKWGFNFEGRIFNGIFGNNLMPEPPLVNGDKLMIKWNDAWLSNKSCDYPINTELDRNHDSTNYQGSGAWLTNHATGVYSEGDNSCKWSDFMKVIAVPKEAQLDTTIESPKCKISMETGFDGYMWRLGGKEIGCSIWSAYHYYGLAVVEEISSDPCGKKENLMNYRSQTDLGLGGN